MGLIIYNISLALYGLTLKIAAIVNPKAKQWIEGQRQLFQALSAQSFHETIWFHCASVGEFEQGFPLMEILKKQFPSSSFLVSFFSPSGYHFVKKKYPAWNITFLPLDNQKHAHQFIEIIQPKAVFFVKYEFWYHYLNSLAIKQIPVFLISGIFRKNQLFFKPYGQFHRKMLGYFTHLFVQNEESKILLKQIGLENVSITGDTRFDRVMQLKSTPFEDKLLDDFTAGAYIFIAGSIWASDENALKKIMALLPKDWKIILAPHEIHHYSTNWIGLPIERYSASKPIEGNILLLDTMGILSKAYRYASLVYIGGGYGKGIHNILEACVYGIPVLFGPHFNKFDEAKQLIKHGIACSTEDEECPNWIKGLINSPSDYKSLQQKSDIFMTMNANVSSKIYVYLNDHHWLG